MAYSSAYVVNLIDLPSAPAASDKTLADITFEDIVETVSQSPGDPQRCRELSERQLCSACHTVTASQPVKDPYLGAAMVIAKKVITHRGTRQTSIMPEGLIANLTLPDFASLLAFLESLNSQ